MKVKHVISSPTSAGPAPSSSASCSASAVGGVGGVGGATPPGGQAHHTRFPKLEEYAHFHYDLVEIPVLKVTLCGDEDSSSYKHNVDAADGPRMFLVTVTGSAPKPWMIRRTVDNFEMLDKQLHRCIFDRKFSHLEDLTLAQLEVKTRQEVQSILQSYLGHFSELAGGMVNCGSVLSWMEMDNRGHRLVATDDSGINTPAIAAAHVVKRYNAQAADEISLQVGDMISVIDMPPAEDTIWWRGKRGFEVGFFPSECVEVIGDKVPSAVVSRIPEPVASAAAARKPLMRKHGKLLSFLRTFFSHRPPRNQLKQSGIVKERVFGCDLGEHLLNSGHDVPLLLKSCTDIIEEYGIVHGIYRLSGITSNIQKLRLAFDEDRVPDLTEECYLQDIHSISSLLKMYFRELPNPLLTYQLYDKFADAVRDEDNKLLRIHDVVQQLPPPHYRTLEYLMRHLARVAALGHETEMHSKNLAIVWAPNLLRSKELEAGGGAAALQGVGIQAVVTECLICYSDIIFSDKMPSYGSQDNGNQKKPRPKSLAISTPTRLLSLEEARERAFMTHLAPSQKFIDVGGGPKNLPSKYHTVIDLPGYKKKVPSSSKENKPASGKKSSQTTNGTGNVGGGGWKSIFSKPRSGSVKKSRKGSGQEPVALGPAQAKALTEEDVHNWKRHLRSAKSAESLFSLSNSPSARSSISSRTSRSNVDNSTVGGKLSGKQDSTGAAESKALRSLAHLSHKRSLSSDASSVLHNRYRGDGTQVEVHHHVPIDVDDDEDLSGKQSFIRGDSSRKAMHHRRAPSAPNTPGQDRRHGGMERSSSLNRGETSGSDDMDLGLDDFVYPKSESRGDVNIDAAIKSRLLQVAEKNRSAKSNEELTLTSSPLKRSAKTPPKGRKKPKGSGHSHVGSSEDELSSPTNTSQLCPQKVIRSSSDISGSVGADISPYDNDDRESRMRRFYSRFHDYAEILSDDEAIAATPSSQGTMSVSSSGCNMQDVLDQIDSRLAMTAKLFPRQGIGDTSGYRVGDPPITRETVFSRSVETTVTSATSAASKETEFSVMAPSAAAATSSGLLAGSSRETEFPATCNTSPRELSSHQTNTHEHLGLDPDADTHRSLEGQSSSKLSPNQGGTEVSRRRVEISRADSSGRQGSSNSSPQHAASVTDGQTSSTSAPCSTRVVRRQAEFIPSSGAAGSNLEDLNTLLDNLENNGSPHRRTMDPSYPTSSNSVRSPEHRRQNASTSSSSSSKPQDDDVSSSQPFGSRTSPVFLPPGTHDGMMVATATSPGLAGMSKCLSVPSDIARSLENVTASQTDMMSSVTISELSMSVNSFNNGMGVDDHRGGPHSRAAGYGAMYDNSDLRRRRSTSLDSLGDGDRLMTRTLREINRQMDAAFKTDAPGDGSQDLAAAYNARDAVRHQRLISSDLDLSSSPETKMAGKGFHDPSSSGFWGGPGAGSELHGPREPRQEGEAWASSDSIVQLEASDQSITPTQSSADRFSLVSHLPPHHSLQPPPAAVDPSSFLSVRSGVPKSMSSDDSSLRSSSLVPGSSDGGLVRVLSDTLSCPSDISPTLTNVTPEFSPDAIYRQQHQQQQQQASLSSSSSSSLSQPSHVHQGKQFTFSTSSSLSNESDPFSPRPSDVTRRRSDLHDPRGAAADEETYRHEDGHIVAAPGTRSGQQPCGHKDIKSPISKTYVSDTVFGHRPSSQGQQSSSVGRSDVAYVYKKRSSSSSSTSSVSSKSSEEFDEVASPEEEEGDERQVRPPVSSNVVVPVSMADSGPGGEGNVKDNRRGLSLPLGGSSQNERLVGNEMQRQVGRGRGHPPAPLGNLHVDLSGIEASSSYSPPSSHSPVVRRQHSPRVSPRGMAGARAEPGLADSGAHEGSGRQQQQQQQHHFQQQHELLHLPSSPLFSGGPAGQMLADAETSERMSSLCAVGLMSQRARLSRESSCSSLQSPDSLTASCLMGAAAAANTRSPLATPVKEALPDIIQSTTQPDEGGGGVAGSDPGDQTGRSNVPLQLALYHPDEFSMDISAAVSGPPPAPIRQPSLHPSPSLPQVHTSSDTVMERKPTLRKSSTENAISAQLDKTPPSPSSSTSHQEMRESGTKSRSQPSEPSSRSLSNTTPATSSSSSSSSSLRKAQDPNLRALQDTSSPDSFRHRASSDSLTKNRTSNTAAFQDRRGNLRPDVGTPAFPDLRGAQAGPIAGQEASRRRPQKQQQHQQQQCHQEQHQQQLQQNQVERDEQVAMEVDNLCNKLVDDLNSPQSVDPPSDFPSEVLTARASQDVRTDVDEQGTVSMEVETSLEVKGSEHSSPVVQERRILRSSSDNGQNVEETRMVSVKGGATGGRGGGDMEEEEVQNVLNQGREILMSPDVSEGQGLSSSSTGRMGSNEAPTASRGHQQGAAAAAQLSTGGQTGNPTLDEASSSSSSASSSSSSSSNATTLPRPDSGIPVRKTSFSKIPRPKTGSDGSSTRTSNSATSSPNVSASRRPESASYPSSSMSSSMYADISLGSSSSPSSLKARRGSEATSGPMSKRQGHTRRASDTKVTDLRTVSPTSRSHGSPQGKSDSTSTRGVTSPRGRSSAGSDSRPSGSSASPQLSSSSRSSRIPMSHKIPSPQQSERRVDSSSSSSTSSSSLGTQGLSKQGSSKSRSPIPKPRKSSSSGSSGAGGGGGAKEAGVPPSEEVIEITRQSVKRENLTKSGGAASRDLPGRKDVDGGGRKTVVIKDMPDKGGAKLVIDTQPDLKKRIQTVHAKKVSQPPRQLAEALDSEDSGQGQGCERPSEPVVAASTAICRSPAESSVVATPSHSVTFSEEVTQHSPQTSPTTEGGGPPSNEERKKTPPPVAKRKFHYDSKSLPRRSKQLNNTQVSLVQQRTAAELYSDMVGSRSSLDDSVLQLAAERHDHFVPPGDSEAANFAYCSGSLRAKRSQKMQSLVNLFERGSDSNVSDSSGSPGTRHRDRTYSGSVLGSNGPMLTPCFEGRADLDVDDDPFLASSSSPPQVLRHSAGELQLSLSRERIPSYTSARSSESSAVDKENVERLAEGGHKRARQGRGSSGDMGGARPVSGEVGPSHQGASPGRKPSATDRASRQSGQPSSTPAPGGPTDSGILSSPATATKSSRPPRYRSNSKPRTQSESSTSESDTTHQIELTHSQTASATPSSRDSFPSAYPAVDSVVLRDSGQTPVKRERRLNHNRHSCDLPSESHRRDGLLSSSTSSVVPLSPSMSSSSSSSSSVLAVTSNSHTPPASPRRKSERRNSIKELRQVFERSESDPASSDVPLSLSPTSVAGFPSTSALPPPRPLTRSMSPQPDPPSGQREQVNLMRLSLELPPSAAIGSIGPTPATVSAPDARVQSVRLGPKPFYGAQK
ncbi:serine-rich adhesin for platelets [Aplysia californica]|uniref:Serine-rich adhesin for platelets n=1 Tax=Aplysia californica TaxID=6500 RepID=A0ABM1VX59_APLCA|nr:serine-rich adhesin for platelets [Aplysia californica]